MKVKGILILKIILLLTLMVYFANQASAQQTKYTPSSALHGYSITRSYGTIAQWGWNGTFLTYSNDSGLSCLSVANDGTLWKGYDALPNSTTAVKHHENMAVWNTIIRGDGQIYAIGNYHVAGSSADVCYPMLLRISPQRGDSTGINMYMQKYFKEQQPGYSGNWNNGGGNDLHFINNKHIGVLQNFIPYRKMRPLIKNPLTYNYNLGEDISFMLIDTAGKRQWGKVYIDSTAGGLNKKGTQVGLSYMVTSAGEFVITGLVTCKHTPVSGCTNKYDLLLMKLRADGSFVWMKKYHHGRESRGFRIFENAKGRYVVAGMTKEDSANRTKDSSLLFLTEFDTAGKVQWAKTYHVWPKKGSPPAGWNTGSFDAAISNDKTYYVLTGDAFKRRGTDSVTTVLAVDTFGKFKWAKMYDQYTQNHEFSITATVEGGFAVADFRNSTYKGKAMGVKKAYGDGVTWCQEHDTVFAVDTIQWMAPETTRVVTVTGFDSAVFPIRTANHFVDQSSCGDHNGATAGFTFSTDHCTCGLLALKSKVPEDADFYVDQRWQGRDTEVYVKDCDTGHHRIRVVNHAIWPASGDDDTTMFINLYAGFYKFNIQKNSPTNFTFTVQNPPSNLRKYYWTFGDGSPVDSVNLSVTHTFTAGKSYDVCLRTRRGFTTEYCESVVCRTICVPDAHFNCCNCDKAER